MTAKYKDAFIQIDLRWKKHLIKPEAFLRQMEPVVYRAAMEIKNRAALMASGPALKTGAGLGRFRVRIDSGNYRRLMFVRTQRKGKSIRVEIGSAAVDVRGKAYPKFVEYYTKNFQLSMYEKWKSVQTKIFSSAQKIIGGGARGIATKL